MHPNILFIVVQFQMPSYNTFWDTNYFLVWFKQKIPCWLEEIFLECSSYFSRMHPNILYIVVQFQIPTYNTFQEINYFLVWFLV